MAASGVTESSVNRGSQLGDVEGLLDEAELHDGCRMEIESKLGTDAGRIGVSKRWAVEACLSFGGRPRRGKTFGVSRSIFLLFVVLATGALHFRTGFPEVSASAGRVGLGRSFI